MKTSSPEAFLEKIPLSLQQDVPAVAFFVGRISGLLLPSDRQAALLLQEPIHLEIIRKLFPPIEKVKAPCLVTAEQCHGSEIALIESPAPEEKQKIPNVDGLMTSSPNLLLGIRVADCAPVWIVDRRGRAGALLHAGRKGTEAGILPKAIEKMQKTFQLDPSEMVITIGPCIRPPHYEIDFAQILRDQAHEAGVTLINDQQVCTASHPQRYYSYRRERGKTGRMLALLLLRRSN